MNPVSEDPYLRLLVKLYKFLARRTEAHFNQVILRRLVMSRNNRPPVSLQKLAGHAEGKTAETIFVIVGTVTDDERTLIIPKMTVTALHVTESARARIEKSGGKIMTFDQLALQRPTGRKTVLLQGARRGREVFKHFRGIHGKHAVPYIRAATKTGRKHETGRGRRSSRGFKI